MVGRGSDGNMSTRERGGVGGPGGSAAGGSAVGPGGSGRGRGRGRGASIPEGGHSSYKQAALDEDGNPLPRGSGGGKAGAASGPYSKSGSFASRAPHPGSNPWGEEREVAGTAAAASTKKEFARGGAANEDNWRSKAATGNSESDNTNDDDLRERDEEERDWNDADEDTHETANKQSSDASKKTETTTQPEKKSMYHIFYAQFMRSSCKGLKEDLQTT